MVKKTHEMCKTKVQQSFIVTKYENVDTKGILQSNGTRSYFMFNRLNDMKGSTFICTFLGT